MIEIYDTTLRDGTQRKGISLSCQDKLRIAVELDRLGVHYIEGGWPGSNPKDIEFFSRAKDMTWHNAKISAFGSTCRPKTNPEDDANLKALIESQTPVCTLFGKTWTLHVTDVLRTTLEDNLRLIEASVAYLTQQGREVVYDAEHFFDGYKADPAYALQTLQAAVRGGASRVVLADTNGGSHPWEVETVVRAVLPHIPVPLGIHAHNDGEFAVANSIAAYRAGCTHIQGTINGYGERCGNANLCSILPNLELKFGEKILPEGQLQRLYELSRFVSELANLAPDDHLPYVGKAAFAHKGGVHVAAMRRNANSYQHINPALVGNQMQVVVSELSGRGNLISKSEEYGIALDDTALMKGVLEDIKQLESQGYSFEAAEASVALMIHRQKPGYTPPFKLIDFSAQVEHRQGRGIFAEATVKVEVQGQVLHTAAEGDGPVSALDKALRKALEQHYPQIHRFHLSDYKVRILDGDKGTSATTRVLIDTRNGTKAWSTVGASSNIIEASWRALADSIEYGLLELK
ncbi:transferase [Ornatilinea apprima]|uniref:Citramalate synthase n=1 Tax=Ornatilinea apprima TaxID=1134406 RepID=A0A0P6X7J8_9CHLR|nr:citramalate synthase [Ornatilinea apprima]KPL70135.1 transferase [Ornatilinea apprima]